MTPKTTFAGGRNPFAGQSIPKPAQQLPPINVTEFEATMIKQPPAKKSAKRIKDEDHSTPYVPPVQPDAVTVKPAVVPANNPFEITVTNDPITVRTDAGQCKYHDLFASLTVGQAMRVPSGRVDSVRTALAKWAKTHKPGTKVRGTEKYCTDTGFGRVWLLAGSDKKVA